MDNSDVYHEAMSTHRHYDTLSQAAITAAVAVIGATPIAFDRVKDLHFGGLVFCGGAWLLWLSFTIYSRFDAHAAMALKFAELLERETTIDDSLGIVRNEKRVAGIAHAFHSRQEHEELDLRAGGFVYRRVRTIVIATIVVFAVTGSIIILTNLLGHSLFNWF